MFFSLSWTIRITLIAHFSGQAPKRRERRSSAHHPRQHECEHRAFARLAVDANRTAVQLDEPPRQRKPESRSFVLARVLATHLPELLEHRLVVGGGDSDPGVLDGDLQVIAH